MESNYKNRDFERFLKQNADQYRMFPSENVWRGIDNALHTRHKWYGLGLALLLIMTGAGVTLVMLTSPTDKDGATKIKTENTVQFEPLSAEHTPSALSRPLANGPLQFNAPVQSMKEVLPNENNLSSLYLHSGPVEDIAAESGNLAAVAQSRVNSSIVWHPWVSELSPFIQQKIGPVGTSTNNIQPDAILSSEGTGTLAGETQFYPLTIESVTNSYQSVKAKKTLSLQVYFSPTVSYRKLSENKAFLRSAASTGTVPPSAAYSDVNNAVTHKPDVGLEVGVVTRYPLSRALLIKGGLQFNVSRYDIRAFYNPGEIATIALDAGAGNNTISRATVYRNYSGSRTNWLQNLYYSAAVPIGAEYRFAGKKSNFFAIGASVQPTYIISDRAFLLSTDYKNYVEVPSLIRRWNLNTGLEAMVGFSTDKAEWQIGPQVRYQVHSSFVDQYPLNENLFDFGLKIGVTLKN